MIPKIIHYCWFGGKPLPESAKKCIASWRKFLPDYEIKEWNESNFDVNIIPYTAEAYKAKKYAFVSDYARFYILYKYGGLYFDTDVEVIRNMDDIIARGPFMGCEGETMKGFPQDKSLSIGTCINPGLGIGATVNLSFYKEILDIYSKLHYIISDRSVSEETVVTITTQSLYRKGFENKEEVQEVNGIWIYPKEYFCPMSNLSKKLEITKNTRSIHHYDGTWLPPKQKLAMWIKMHLGERVFDLMCRIQRLVK